MCRLPWPTFHCAVTFDVEDLIEKKVNLLISKCVYNKVLKIGPAPVWHLCHVFSGHIDLLKRRTNISKHREWDGKLWVLCCSFRRTQLNFSGNLRKQNNIFTLYGIFKDRMLSHCGDHYFCKNKYDSVGKKWINTVEKTISPESAQLSWHCRCSNFRFSLRPSLSCWLKNWGSKFIIDMIVIW